MTGTRPPFWAIIILAFAGLACGGPAVESQLVDVGEHRLNVRCLGTGTPTVVLEAGLGATSRIWSEVEERVADKARVCSYDRAGLGGSQPGVGVYTADRSAAELETLLANAGVQAPVVLVGHSYGGLIAQIFVSENPAMVSGLVLLDSLHPDNLKQFSALASERAYRLVLGAVSGGHEDVDLEASMEEARGASIPQDLPLSVVTAGRTDLPPFLEPSFRASLAAAWLEAQRKLAALSANSTHIVVQDSGHCIQCEKPKLVADVIIQMVEKARAGG